MAKAAHQVTVNEAVQEVTGKPTPADVVPIKIPEVKRTRAKAGQQGLFVYLTQAQYDVLVISADGRPLNAWLSRLIDRNFETLVPKV